MTRCGGGDYWSTIFFYRVKLHFGGDPPQLPSSSQLLSTGAMLPAQSCAAACTATSHQPALLQLAAKTAPEFMKTEEYLACHASLRAQAGAAAEPAGRPPCVRTMVWRLALPLLAAAHAATAAPPSVAGHTAIADAVVAAMNGPLSAGVPQLLALLDEKAAWCDPFPSCHHGKTNITSFLRSLPASTVAVGSVGGMMVTLSFSFPGSDASCLYTADQHLSWNLSSSTAGTEALTVNYVHWVYNASAFEASLGSCLGPAAAQAWQQHTRGGGGGDDHIVGGALHTSREDRSSDLKVVMDYVVSLQNSISAQALICDLLLPSARYCDPFPLSCAIGRSGCREMKGLPPDNSSSLPDIAAVLAAATTESTSEHCRAASVRPLMATGPVTGAMYLVYSSVSRGALGRAAKHRLHHTFAIWDLAPPNATAAPPDRQHRHRGAHGELVPLLSSFSWFMPDHNV
jgi:hypothetical protein